MLTRPTPTVLWVVVAETRQRSGDSPDLASRRAVDPGALDGTAYRFIRVLGRGGMGTVIECEHIGLARPVVVKLLHPEFAERPDFVDRLRIEAQALARMDHPNLVRVSDFGLTPAGVPFLAMEKLEGRTLADELDKRGYLPMPEALELLCQALDGLSAAHAHGIVHRDVKPANLFVCDTPRGRQLKVLDFGIAKVLAEADLGGLAPKYRTQQGTRLGTPLYIAPEQLKGGIVMPVTDVYATGLVLYRTLVGRHPFAQAGSVDAVHRAQLLEMPPAPSTRAPQPLPHDLDRIVLRSVAKLPEDRFTSAASFAEALRAVLAGQTAAPDSRWASTEAGQSTLATPPIDSPLTTAASSPLARARIAPTARDGARAAPPHTQLSAGQAVPPGTLPLEEPAAPSGGPRAPATLPLAPAQPAFTPAARASPTTPVSLPSKGLVASHWIGILCLLGAVLQLFWQVWHAFAGVLLVGSALVEGSWPDGIDGATLLAEATLATVMSLALGLIGGHLVRDDPGAPYAAWVWARWALVVVGVILVLRLVGMVAEWAKEGVPSAPLIAGGVLMAIGVPILEGALVLLLRSTVDWARR